MYSFCNRVRTSPVSSTVRIAEDSASRTSGRGVWAWKMLGTKPNSSTKKANGGKSAGLRSIARRYGPELPSELGLAKKGDGPIAGICLGVNSGAAPTPVESVHRKFVNAVVKIASNMDSSVHPWARAPVTSSRDTKGP